MRLRWTFENEVMTSYRTPLNSIRKHVIVYRKELTRLKLNACVDVTRYSRTLFHLEYIRRRKLFGSSALVDKMWLSCKLVIFLKESFVEIYRDLLLWRSHSRQSSIPDRTQGAIFNYREVICNNAEEASYIILRETWRNLICKQQNFTSKISSTF